MDTHTEHVARQLAQEMASWKSIEVRVRTGISDHRVGSGVSKAFDVDSEHYIETSAGRRFSEHLGLKNEKTVTRYMYFCDGSKCADVSFSREDASVQQSVVIKRQYGMEGKSDRKQLPAPLLYFYVGREPLYEALTKGRPAGQSEVMGRACDEFLFEGVRWDVTQDQVFYLDRQTSVPLKVDSFRDAAARQKGQVFGTWTARSFDRVQGLPMVLKSTQTAYAPDGNLQFTWDFDVQSIEFGKDYPASTFWPVLRPGVTVLDSIANKAYQTPGGQKSPQETRIETAVAVQPIRAEVPRAWSSLAPGVTLGVGCAALLAAGVMWWRRAPIPLGPHDSG